MAKTTANIDYVTAYVRAKQSTGKAIKSKSQRKWRVVENKKKYTPNNHLCPTSKVAQMHWRVTHFFDKVAKEREEGDNTRKYVRNKREIGLIHDVQFKKNTSLSRQNISGGKLSLRKIFDAGGIDRVKMEIKKEPVYAKDLAEYKELVKELNKHPGRPLLTETLTEERRRLGIIDSLSAGKGLEISLRTGNILINIQFNM